MHRGAEVQSIAAAAQIAAITHSCCIADPRLFRVVSIRSPHRLARLRPRLQRIPTTVGLLRFRPLACIDLVTDRLAAPVIPLDSDRRYEPERQPSHDD